MSGEQTNANLNRRSLIGAARLSQKQLNNLAQQPPPCTTQKEPEPAKPVQQTPPPQVEENKVPTRALQSAKKKKEKRKSWHNLKKRISVKFFSNCIYHFTLFSKKTIILN